MAKKSAKLRYKLFLGGHFADNAPAYELGQVQFVVLTLLRPTLNSLQPRRANND